MKQMFPWSLTGWTCTAIYRFATTGLMPEIAAAVESQSNKEGG